MGSMVMSDFANTPGLRKAPTQNVISDADA
ncbi:hypothetical protein NKDENANG_00591 [Candidatus Entotheonellaceae bacterium PAL068K]